MTSAPLPLRGLRRVARTVHQRTNDFFLQWHLRHAGVARAHSIQSYTSAQELRALFDIVSSCPKGTKALEIGSHLGASTCFIGAALQPLGGHLYCVDTWHNETMPEGEQDTFQVFKQNTASLNGVTTLIRKRSDALTEKEISLPLQFAFLDGDHSYESTKKDFELVSPWMAENGIIAFHDCMYFEGVSRVIGEALAGRQWMVAGHLANLMWIKRAKWRR